MNCANGHSWCGNESGRGYCSDLCRGDRKMAEETRRIDVALKEYDARVAPPSDQDVRAALTAVIRNKSSLTSVAADFIAAGILSDPLLGKLLRGGR